MPIQDTVPETTLERWVSDDFNDAQALLNRQLAEIVRAMVRTLEVSNPYAPPAAAVRPHVASGLSIEQSGGSTIVVNPGVLMQQVSASPPDVPAPGTLDSSYRFGLLLAAEDVTDPWDGTSAWWTLGARVERETTLSEIRDIYNPTAVPPTFTPSAAAIDKRYESQPEFLWKKGTATAIPASLAAGYAPIGAVYRPVGGGNINDSNVIQLSMQLEDISHQTGSAGHPVRNDFRFRSEEGIGAVVSGFRFSLDAEIGGARCWAKTTAVMDLRDSTTMEAASAAALLVSNTWGYVYLAPVDGMMPSGVHPGMQHKGAVIVSRTPPDDFGRNTATLTAPDPINRTVVAGDAVCIAILRSQGASWQFCDIGSDGEGRVEIREFNNDAFPMNSGNAYGNTGSPWALSTIGPGGTEDVPYGVHLKCFVDPTAIDVTATALALETTFSLAPDSASATRYPRHLLSTRTGRTLRFELYPRDGALTPANMALTVTYAPRDAAMASAGTPGTNAYRAGLWGIRF